MGGASGGRRYVPLLRRGDPRLLGDDRVHGLQPAHAVRAVPDAAPEDGAEHLHREPRPDSLEYNPSGPPGLDQYDPDPRLPLPVYLLRFPGCDATFRFRSNHRLYLIGQTLEYLPRPAVPV